ncbi:hypothetical protein HNO88_002977 [Novosphingobium chloroacetimidivorans]|uniref:Uncharacterized protein n=2 Tax=Novosphingobium chloroacetimidivorans TaxID=1428314 RepID=A0A7W7KCF8_9SPHN|nr:hypothetical protein [Novosphingobium chloroacetimidivorans]
MEAMSAISACLPSQHRGEFSQKLRSESYWRMLGGYPLAAIEHLQRVALERFRWFPTIAECIPVLDEIGRKPPLTGKQQRVRAAINRERQARFDDAMAALAVGDVEQAWINALPERWKLIAEARMLLWLHDDGSFTLRREVADVAHSTAR